MHAFFWNWVYRRKYIKYAGSSSVVYSKKSPKDIVRNFFPVNGTLAWKPRCFLHWMSSWDAKWTVWQHWHVSLLQFLRNVKVKVEGVPFFEPHAEKYGKWSTKVQERIFFLYITWPPIFFMSFERACRDLHGDVCDPFWISLNVGPNGLAMKHRSIWNKEGTVFSGL